MHWRQRKYSSSWTRVPGQTALGNAASQGVHELLIFSPLRCRHFNAIRHQDPCCAVRQCLQNPIDLDKAIEMVTTKPAQVFNFGVSIGTLKPGSEADSGIFELQDRRFEFKDGVKGKRMGRQKLTSKAVVCRGELFSNEIG
jgi:predicted amidohydrolase